MAIIHMDTDAARSVVGNINSTKENLTSQAQTLLNLVNNMVGTDWIATGATQYQSDIQEWNSALINAINQLENFSARLSQEIIEFENTAQTS